MNKPEPALELMRKDPSQVLEISLSVKEWKTFYSLIRWMKVLSIYCLGFGFLMAAGFVITSVSGSAQILEKGTFSLQSILGGAIFMMLIPAILLVFGGLSLRAAVGPYKKAQLSKVTFPLAVSFAGFGTCIILFAIFCILRVMQDFYRLLLS